MREALLAVDSLMPGRGGISRVARLMARVLDELRAEGKLRAVAVTLSDSHSPGDLHLPVYPCCRSKVRFLLAALRRGAACSHLLFDAAPLAQMHGLPFLRRRPSLTYIHGIEVWERAPAKYIASAQSMSMQLANSDFTRRKADRLHGGFADARLCWLATEEDERPALAASIGERPPVALIVGRLVADRPKGHRELIACWPAVVAAVPDAQLHIVGDGPDRPALEALVARSPAAQRIVFHGFVGEDGLAAHYVGARVYAMPSRGEGFGLVYVEAMRHGLPVIASVHDAAGEIVVNGETGYVVDQDKAEVLIDALVRMLGEPRHAATLGEAGQRRWATHFRFGAFRQRFVPLLQAFLEQS